MYINNSKKRNDGCPDKDNQNPFNDNQDCNPIESLKIINKEIKNKFPLTLSEKTIREKAQNEWSLRLLSNYGEYKNYNSILNMMCIECGNIFSDSITNISRRKFPCPECGKKKRKKRPIIYKDCVKLGQKRVGLDFGMTRSEFRIAMDNRGPTNPSHVRLEWRCTINPNHTWFATYNNIKKGTKCPHCRVITYEDCIRLGQKREDMDFGMIQSEFRTAMDNRRSTVPSKVRLTWICTIKINHSWHASYNNIKNERSGCPFCGERAKLIGTYSHPPLKYFTLEYLRLKNCQGKHEASVVQDEKFRIDLLIERDNKFKNNIEKYQNIVQIPSYINQISIDYTFSLDFNNILEKCFKEYHSEVRFLLIVLMREQRGSTAQKFHKLIRDTPIIDDKEKIHIKVINFEEYLAFLNMQSKLSNWIPLSEAEKDIVSKLRGARKLGIDALSSDLKFAKLMKFGSYYSDLLRY